MDEKTVLLMEETSCDQAEAELALELAHYNLEKAVRTIRSILRNIVVVKSKFSVTDKNLYGLFIMILNKRSKSAIRVRCVVSYNPIIYESDLSRDWDHIEALIYRYRLLEGSVLSFAHSIEDHLSRMLTSCKDRLYRSLEEKNPGRIQDIITDGSPHTLSAMQVVIEEINLADYQDGSSKRELPEKRSNTASVSPEYTRINLEVKLQEDKGGRKVSSLSKGDVVLAQIVDTREVARYLTKLLCRAEPSFLPVAVEDISHGHSGMEVYLHFTPRIIGFTSVKQNMRVKVIKKAAPPPWWKKLFQLFS